MSRKPQSRSQPPRKPGRPRTNPTSIHLTLTPEVLERLDGYVEDHDMRSRAEAVRELLAKHLPRRRP